MTGVPTPGAPRAPAWTLLKGTAAFIGWLAGYVGGVTAILYACGFLVTRAHQNALGLFGLVEYGHQHFVQEGAKFLLVVGQSMARIALPLALPGIVAAGVVAVLLAVGRRSAWFRWGREAWTARLGHVGGPGAGRRLAYALLLALLILHADTYLEKFSRPLLVSNLLYADPQDAGAARPAEETTEQIRTWLLAGDAQRATTHFYYLLWGAVLAGGLLLASWQLVAHWAAGPGLTGLLLAPFVISFSLYALSVPMLYGVLVRPTRYPVVVLEPRSEAPAERARLFLLNKTDRELVLWDGSRRRVLWVATTDLRRAEVQGVESLFARDPAGRDEAAAARPPEP